ncbi:hypothetical protein Hanom_Chr13g01197621 [Helianthus anomalus]
MSDNDDDFSYSRRPNWEMICRLLMAFQTRILLLFPFLSMTILSSIIPMLDEDIIVIPLSETPVIEISSDSILPSISYSFESVTFSSLQAVGLRRYANDYDDDTTMSLALTPPLEFELDLEPLSDHDPIPFGIADIAPLIPDPVPTHVDPPAIEPLIPPPAPAEVTSSHSMEFDVHHDGLPSFFFQDIPVPHLGEGTSSQQPSHDPHDELLYSLQLRFKVMSHRILELESIPRSLLCPCHSTSVPPHSSPPPFARPPAPLTPFPEIDARFHVAEQQIRYLLRRVHKLEEELAHVLSLIFPPPPPPPPPPPSVQ